MSKEKLIVALDVPTKAQALNLAQKLADQVGFFKVGMELFYAAGPDVVRQITATGAQVFLDLKLHDIPNTVGSAAKVLVGVGAAIINVHAAGGQAMMQAAQEAVKSEAQKLNVSAPLVVAVTVLTSINQQVFNQQIGFDGLVQDKVRHWALLAQASGLDGVVCSPREIQLVREVCGTDFKIITPGIRPTGADLGDQSRVMTPGAAVKAGASHIVVGRPITAADDPAGAAKQIIDEIKDLDKVVK